MLNRERCGQLRNSPALEVPFFSRQRLQVLLVSNRRSFKHLLAYSYHRSVEFTQGKFESICVGRQPSGVMAQLCSTSCFSSHNLRQTFARLDQVSLRTHLTDLKSPASANTCRLSALCILKNSLLILASYSDFSLCC